MIEEMEYLLEGAKSLGLKLTTGQLEEFYVYSQEILCWNQKSNLTAITDPKEIQIKHLLDSLSIYPLIQNIPGLKVIDIGSGAGLPGIPLKIVLPDIEMVLLETNSKKASFLMHITETLEIKRIQVITGRAEEIAHFEEYREKFQVVLSRAVASLPVLVELTLPFATLGGRLIAQKKNSQLEVTRSGPAIRELGGKLLEIRSVELEGLEGHELVIIEKIEHTPEKYPRHTGIPSKRPLGLQRSEGKSGKGLT